LGVNNWTVEECIIHFKKLCRKAFVPRELIGTPLLEHLSLLNHGSMYKTKPFETLLQETFSNQPLFGGSTETTEMATKVAITTTSALEQHPVVLANYNRPDPVENSESKFTFDGCLAY
jgi:hypothetical protein